MERNALQVAQYFLLGCLRLELLQFLAITSTGPLAMCPVAYNGTKRSKEFIHRSVSKGNIRFSLRR